VSLQNCASTVRALLSDIIWRSVGARGRIGPFGKQNRHSNSGKSKKVEYRKTGNPENQKTRQDSLIMELMWKVYQAHGANPAAQNTAVQMASKSHKIKRDRAEGIWSRMEKIFRTAHSNPSAVKVNFFCKLVVENSGLGQIGYQAASVVDMIQFTGYQEAVEILPPAPPSASDSPAAPIPAGAAAARPPRAHRKARLGSAARKR
jgi:hypothetical protein